MNINNNCVFYSYKGKKVALYYWRLWEEKAHLVRLVDTYELLDADRLNRFITFDVSNVVLVRNDAINKRIMPKTDPEIADAIVLPLILLPKHPIFDVDASINGSIGVHLCRRSVNICATAHILMGLCMSMNFKGDHNILYKKVCYFLGLDREPSGVEKKNAREELIDFVHKYTHSEGDVIPEDEGRNKLDYYLKLFTSYYIQCIEYPICESKKRATSIVKIRINDTIESVSSVFGDVGTETNGTIEVEQRSKGGPDKNGDLVGEPETLNKRKKVRRARARRLAESVGVLSTTVEIPQMIGWLKTQSGRHTRFIAPPGAIISDVHVLRDEKKLLESGDTLLNHTAERLSFVIRDQSAMGYRILVKLNPILSNLIIPAVFVSILQLAIVSIALAVGPDVVARNAVAFTGTAIVAPFVTVVFIAKESEHSLVGRMLWAPRLLLSSSSAILVIIGAFMSVLPRKETIYRSCVKVSSDWSYQCQDVLNESNNATILHRVAFWGLTAIATLAILCTFLLCRIVWVAWRSRVNVSSRTKTERDAVKFKNNKEVTDSLEKKYRLGILLRAALGWTLFAFALFLSCAWIIWIWVPSCAKWA